MKKEKGITLVALVISIVVLLILATASVQVLTGDNGLLTKTESAVQSNKDSQEEEKIKLAVVAAQVAGEGTITTENLNKELQDIFNDSNEVKPIQDYWNYNGYKINTNGQLEKSLPKEFQKVEYIDSTGTQYIDTKIIANNTTGVKLELSIPDVTNDTVHMGSRSDSLNTRFTIGTMDNHFYFGWGNIYSNYNYIILPNIKYTVNYNYLNSRKAQYGDYGDIEITDDLPNQIYNILIFAHNRIGVIKYSSYKLYTYKISDNQNLKRDFIPCYATTTVTNAEGNTVPEDTKGLYDLVEGKFYTNANTTEGAVDFTAGPEV